MIQRIETGRELNHGSIADLGATLSEQVARGVTELRMNTSRVLQFDSRSLESLLEFDALARSRGLAFVVLNPSKLLSSALQITGLDERLRVVREQDDELVGDPLPVPEEPVSPGEPATGVPGT